MTRAAISAPTPDCGQPSSTVTQRPVFFTDSTIGLGVHRAERAQVDHLGLDALLGEFFGGLERVGHAHRPGDDGDVLARRARSCALPIGSTKSSSFGTGNDWP